MYTHLSSLVLSRCWVVEIDHTCSATTKAYQVTATLPVASVNCQSIVALETTATHATSTVPHKFHSSSKHFCLFLLLYLPLFVTHLTSLLAVFPHIHIYTYTKTHTECIHTPSPGPGYTALTGYIFPIKGGRNSLTWITWCSEDSKVSRSLKPALTPFTLHCFLLYVHWLLSFW